MRLADLFLISTTLVAQSARGLPWDRMPNLPWRALPSEERPARPPLPKLPEDGTLRVTLDPDGALRVVDAKGIILMRTGLPGRPRRLWRDGGRPLSGTSGAWDFPAQTPLRRGIGALPLGQSDFRPALEGILWILDDEERLLTMVHPATSQVTYLALPGGAGLELLFLPDQLAVWPSLGSANAWSLPWLSLLPQFIRLGTPAPAPKRGTALVPFPKD